MNYKIKKGNHYCLHGQWFHYKKENLILNFNISSLNYYYFGNNDDMDINKLGGITYGFNGIHQNSIRLGWNCLNKEQYCLYLYCYNQGNRYIKLLQNCLFDKNYEFAILLSEDGCPIINNIGEIISYVSFDWTNVPKYGFYCYPYFGGNNISPKDVKFKLKMR